MTTPYVSIPGAFLAILVAVVAIPVVSDEDHARTYAWAMEQGSLISNWTFENELEVWSDSAVGGMVDSVRVVPAAFAAQSGRFAARVFGTTNTSGEILLLRTGRVPVQPGQPYTLSFHVRSSGVVGGGCHPSVRLMTDKSGVSRTVNGPGYSTFSGSSTIGVWTLYTLTFTPEDEEPFVDIALWRSASSGVSAALFFDNVVLEEGALSTTEAAARRARHAFSASFSDALGKTHQTFTRLPDDPDSYRIEGVQYDSAGRTWKTVMPIVGGFGFADNLVDAAGAYYYYQETVPGVGSHAYSEVKYADEPSSRVIKSAAPGTVWNLQGGRFTEGGFYFTGNLSVPSNFATPAADNNEREYQLDWTRDEDSAYTLSWTNRRGQTVQTARQVGGGVWAFTRMDYYPSGQIRRIRTPLDTSGATFAELRNYNAQGLLTSSFTKDRGLETFSYNKRGMLRYSQNERQREQSARLFTYFDYDALGNLVSTGEQILYYPTPLQESWVDGNGAGYPDDKTESRGFLYGSLDAFESRTGISLETIPHHSLIDPKPQDNVLMAAWHRNPESRAPGLSPTQKLVVDFYEHDERGRLVQQHKYLGAMGESRLQSVDHYYDEQGRLIHRAHYRNGTAYDMLMEQSYAYDPLGRVTVVTGRGGDTVAQYAYAPRGVLEAVTLGDPASGTNISYAYHVRGWTRGITAQRNDNGHLTWQQLLGYEDRAASESGVPTLSQSRYTGQITQQLYKFTSDVPHPVRIVNYTYNVQGQMTIADYRHGTGLNGSGQLQFPLSLSDANDLDTRVAYDLNGRVAGKRSGAVSSADSAVYVYQSGSYRLDRVTGKLSGAGSRDASSTGNFKYDESGNLVHDGSKNLSISYNHDGMPREFMVVDAPSVTLHQLYDAAGQRVTQLASAAGALTLWVGNSQGDEGAEPYDFSTLAEAMAALQTQLGSRAGSAPDSVVIFVVADEGATEIQPGAQELTIMSMNTQTVPVVIHGMRKHSTRHVALSLNQVGRPLYARHSVIMGGQVLADVSETYDTTGAVTSHRVVATVLGRGTPVGRAVYTDTGVVTQFFVKNHLGSTVRVVNADGSFATTPVFDYQPYGELQSIREDSLNPVGPKYTGKGIDTELNLYYFGARWYDQELGMWMTVDAADQFHNPYGYSGDPVNAMDPNGLRAIYINGIGGADNPSFRSDICRVNPEQCGQNSATENGEPVADYGHAFYGRSLPGAKWWLDLPIAIFGVPAAFTSGIQAYSEIKSAYRQARRDGEPLYVHAHSGGNAASGYGTFYANVQFGYGSVEHRYTYSGADAFWLGTGLSTFSGTRTTSYYNAGDPVSWYGAVWDATNPITALYDPKHNMDAFNLDRWCASGGHSPQGSCRSINDIMQDNWWLGGNYYKWRIAKPADHIFRGLGNGYYKYVSSTINPWSVADRESKYWKNFDADDAGDYYDAWRRYSGRKTMDDMAKDLGCWVNPWCK